MKRKPHRPSPLVSALAGLLEKLPSEQSRRGYEGDWNRYLKWLKRQKLDVRKVRPRDVERYLTRLQAEGKKQATIGRALSVIREVYGALVRDEIMQVNPAREVKTPRIDGAPKTPWLTEEQVKLAGYYSARREPCPTCGVNPNDHGDPVYTKVLEERLAEATAELKQWRDLAAEAVA